MNKAIEILSEWLAEKEKYLVILIDRRESQKYWANYSEEKAVYHYPKYLETKSQVEALEIGIAECKEALKELLPK